MAKMTKHSKNIKDSRESHDSRKSNKINKMNPKDSHDSRDSNKINLKDSHKSTTDLSLNHYDSHNLDSRDMDCFGESCDSSRNDEVVDSHNSNESNKMNPKDSHNPHDSRYSHDKDSTATRILLIIRALCNGASLDSLSLKDFDFNISKRTFQRDIKKIKDFFVENISYIPSIPSQHIATANLNKITKTLKGGGNVWILQI